jgi:hypothetical protein
MVPGVDSQSSQTLILDNLNKRRFEAAWGTEDESCTHRLQWDDDLAEAAQVWADQCAMVEYRQTATSMF